MKNIKSKQAYKKACRYIPGGVNSPVRSFKSIGINPPFIKRGKGPYIYDEDGNKYIDFCLSWGVHILGHANKKVVNAAKKVITNGTSFGAPTELETRLAQMIVNKFDSIDQVRFVNSGTEAVMTALRLARAFTKKKKIIKFDGCYHGHLDHLLVGGGSGLSELSKPSSDGIPKEFVKETINIPFNDRGAVKYAFKKYANKIAAVIVEPVPANMGVIIPKDGYLKFLRDITKKNKTLLIFDEVITGFRLAINGAQGVFNIKPDLTCLGKIIGGGFPVGVVGGRKEIMSLLAPQGPVYQAGTLSGNPVAMSVGIEVLKVLSKDGFYKRLNKKSEEFTTELRKNVKKVGFHLNSFGSMFTIFFSNSKEPPSNYSDVQKCNIKKFARFYRKLLSRGIYLSPSQFESNFVSMAHLEKDLTKTIKNLKKIFNSYI